EHLLFVVRGSRAFRLDRGRRAAQRLVEELDRALGCIPGLQVFVVPSTNVLGARICSVPGALVYARGRAAGIEFGGILVPAFIGFLLLDGALGPVAAAAVALAAAGAALKLRWRSLAGSRA